MSCPRQSAISSSSGSANGACAGFSATPATASTACSARCKRAKGKIEFIQARHEEMAAFMASAHAKFTGELGVCIATSGPGASHLITGLYDARLDHMPVLAIVRPAGAHRARRPLPAGGRPAGDVPRRRRRLRRSRPRCPAQVRHLIDRAVRIALASARVTALDLPERPAGAALRGAAARARHAAFRRRLHRAPSRALRRRSAPRRRCPQRRQEGRDAGRRRRAARHRRGDRGRRQARRRRAPRRCSARLRCPTICPG